jgi:hypothetical protein
MLYYYDETVVETVTIISLPLPALLHIGHHLPTGDISRLILSGSERRKAGEKKQGFLPYVPTRFHVGRFLIDPLPAFG